MKSAFLKDKPMTGNDLRMVEEARKHPLIRL